MAALGAAGGAGAAAARAAGGGGRAGAEKRPQAPAAAPPLDDLSVEAEAPNLLARGAGLLRRHGVCHLRGAFGPALAAGGGGGLAARAARILADVQRRLDARGLDYTTQTKAFCFADVASRDRGRLDVRHGLDTPDGFASDALLRNPHAMRVAREVLGNDCVPHFSGIVFSSPGSVTQAWHRDGPHLFGDDHPGLPAHALTVFVPLCTVSAAMGSPQFCPGTHMLSDATCNAMEHRVFQVPVIEAGDAIVFDYRVLHRGMGNSSSSGGGDTNGGQVRPLFYVVYAKPWWRDKTNFGSEMLMSGSAGNGNGSGARSDVAGDGNGKRARTSGES